MVKYVLITLGFFFLSVHNCFSTISEPHIYTSYSANKEYKLLVSPFYCNEDSCLTLDEIDSLENNINEEWKTQSLYIYKHINGRYIKIAVFDVPTGQLTVDVPYPSYYYISNDGNTVVKEERRELKWYVLKLNETSFDLSSYSWADLFNLKFEEFTRYVKEVSPYVIPLKTKSRVWTKVKNSLKIKLRYFDMNKQQYIYKNTEIKFD